MATNAPGTLSWAELATPDISTSAAFYCRLFDWNGDAADTIFRKDDWRVAGAGPLQDRRQSAAWTTYIATADADATTEAASAAGGSVVVPPMDVFDWERKAILADPAGTAFGLFQAGKHPGGELFNVPGAMTWNELTTRDVDSAKAFYGSVFGWTFDDADGYLTIRLDGRAVGGIMPMTGDEWPADLPSHWMVYFAVEDCDAAATLAPELGGTTSVPPFDAPPGRIAVLNDRHGAVFSVIALDPDFQA